MSKRRGNPVDMSLPPEQRGRRRKAGSVGGTPPAQMSHASSPRKQRQQRRGERWLSAEETARFAEAGKALLLLDEEYFTGHARQRLCEAPEQETAGGNL